MVVASVKPAGEGIVAHFEGTDTREAAEALTGATVSIERAALPPLGEGEYYHCDLPGMCVVSRSGAVVGEVLRVEAYPTIDALVVQTEQGEVELPMNADVVQSLDLVARVVVVDLSPLEE
jgi:16S rRNA processing protein RimM